MGASNQKQHIARWESRGGKYWVDLYFDPCFTLENGQTVVDVHYRGDGYGGGVNGQTADMQSRIDRGYFQADANKTPMHRVKLNNYCLCEYCSLEVTR